MRGAQEAVAWGRMVGGTHIHPSSAQEVAEAILAAPRVEVRGSFGPKVGYRIPLRHWEWEWLEIAADRAGRVHGDTPEGWDPTVWAETVTLAKRLAGSERPPPTTVLNTGNLTGIHEFDVADQVVVVAAATPLSSLQDALSSEGQCLPLPNADEVGPALGGGPGTIGGMLSMNLPHGLASQCGSWRDWVLGLEVVLGSGRIVKTGCKAVKNVAGYDAMKLFVGARGTLGVVTKVILRTLRLEALPRCMAVLTGDALEWPNWIQRTRRTDFETALRMLGDRVRAYDRPSSTLWAQIARDDVPARFAGDWVLQAGCGKDNVQILDPELRRLMKRAKGILDPDGRLNPGEFGIEGA